MKGLESDARHGTSAEDLRKKPTGAVYASGRDVIRKLAGQYVEKLYRDYPDGLCGGKGGCEGCIETHLVAFGLIVAQSVRRDEQNKQVVRRGSR